MTNYSLGSCQAEVQQMQSLTSASCLQEKYLPVSKQIYMAFVDQEKAFDRVPQKVIWWAMRKLGAEE